MVAIACILVFLECPDISNAMFNVTDGVEGETITLECPLNGVVNTNHTWFKKSAYDLSLGENIVEGVPPDVANRLHVACLNVTCYLTINPLRPSDAGEYTCGITLTLADNTSTNVLFERLHVNVSLSSLVSPMCSLLDKNYNRVKSVTIGDLIGFGCNITNGDPGGTYVMHVARGGDPIIDDVKLAGTGRFSFQYTLTENDRGIDFRCVLDHSSFSEKRTCLLLKLPNLETTTIAATQQTFPDTSVIGTTVSGTNNDLSPVITTTRSYKVEDKLLSFIIPLAISIGSLLFIIVIIITLILLCKNKNKKLAVTSAGVEPHQEPNVEHVDGEPQENGQEYIEMNSLKRRPISESHDYASIKTDAKVINEYAYADVTTVIKKTVMNKDIPTLDGNTVPPVPEIYADIPTDKKRVSEPSQSNAPPAYHNLQRPVKSLNFTT